MVSTYCCYFAIDILWHSATRNRFAGSSIEDACTRSLLVESEPFFLSTHRAIVALILYYIVVKSVTSCRETETELFNEGIDTQIAWTENRCRSIRRVCLAEYLWWILKLVHKSRISDWWGIDNVISRVCPLIKWCAALASDVPSLTKRRYYRAL